jgi:hypothetical protein
MKPTPGDGTTMRHQRRRWRSLRSPAVLCAVALPLGLSSACVGAESQRLSCDDVYAPSDVDFRTIQGLVTDGQKGCVGGPCHTADTQQHGLRLDTPELVYEEMSARPDVFYAYLSSGEMPDQGTPWDEEDLKVFRSWYCAGAFPP